MGLVVMLSIGGATFLLTYGLVVNEVLRWAVTIPLVWVVLLTVLWEVFEALFRGFGDQETKKNRSMDVGIAIVLWAVVVVPTMLIAGTAFPLVLPHRP